MSGEINIKNKKASFEYTLGDKYTAGIQLQGTEVKSVRMGKASIGDAHCAFDTDELWIFNAHIEEYSMGSHANHAPKRKRKLLLNRSELNKLHQSVKTKGNTIVPIRLFINQKGLIKVVIALGKGKKLYDKRQDLKEKDVKREIERGKVGMR